MTDFLNGKDLASFRQTSKASEINSRRAYFGSRILKLRGMQGMTFMPNKRMVALIPFIGGVHDYTGGEALRNLKHSLPNVWNLRELRVQDDEQRPLDLTYVSEHSNLESLDLYGSKVNNWPEILKLKKLRNLELYRLDSAQLPEEIFQLGNLEGFQLNGCAFTRFPASFCNLKNLKRLEVGNSKLEVIPECIQYFKKLKSLDLYWNSREMILPDFIYNMTQLERLFLTGMKIPMLSNKLGLLVNLTTLNIHKCGLLELPESVGQLVRLETLNIAENKLRAIPRSITNLSKLIDFEFEENPYRPSEEKWLDGFVKKWMERRFPPKE